MTGHLNPRKFGSVDLGPCRGLDILWEGWTALNPQLSSLDAKICAKHAKLTGLLSIPVPKRVGSDPEGSTPQLYMQPNVRLRHS